MDISKLSGFLDKINESGSRENLGSIGKNPKGDFGSFISDNINKVNNELVGSEKMAEEFLVEGKHDLHEVMIAMEKADMSFRYMTQVRNKVLDAYSEVMRMQV